MIAAKTKGATAAEPVAWENPLIPHKKLRALYTAMVELRLLEEHVAGLGSGSKVKARREITRNEEGCRVSTALDLKPGDLSSDATQGIATAFLRGTKLRVLLRSVLDPGKSTGWSNSNQLPLLADAAGRLHLAMGAALVLKAKKQNLLTVAYAYRNVLSITEWKPILRFASANALPIIFVILTGADSAKPGQLSLASSTCGVPGIPVDAGDPVALYRVAQESTLRARAGGGPVLMECIPFQLTGKKAEPADPIVTMRGSLLHRKIVDESWLRSVESRFLKRVKVASR